MPQKAPFIGRDTELKRLLQIVAKRTASLVVIKGRRRVGKSRLIEELSQHFNAYYKFEGIAPEKDVTPAHQLAEFCRQIARNFNTGHVHYSDWSDAFAAVGERVHSGKILLFFDELSWMGDEEPTFLPKIKTFWDALSFKNHQLVFIICSSASGWIEHNVLSSTGFVGRVSLTLTLDELSLKECNQFWPKNVSYYEKLKVLSVTGGIPKYLEEIDPKTSAEENIRRLCFSKGGMLVNEFDKIFSDLFMRKSAYYKKIVTVLCERQRDQAEIQTLLSTEENVKHIGRIPDYLRELQESGFIKRDYTWNLKTGEDSRWSQYRLSDNYIHFYLKYIEKNLGKIERNAFEFRSLTALPEWNIIMGLQFENLLLNNRKSIHQKLNIRPDEIVNENPFFQKKTNRHAGCQIDYMIQTKFGTLYVCEIKFSKNRIDSSVISEVQKKIDALQYPRGYSCRPVLLHVNGVTEELVDADYFSSIIDTCELLHE